MNITYDITTQTQSTSGNTNYVKNSSNQYAYLYGVPNGFQVKSTFVRKDGVQIGNIICSYGLDPNGEYCYLIRLVQDAVTVAGGVGLSLLIKDTVNNITYATIKTAFYLYDNDSVIIPEDLGATIAEELENAIANLTDNKLEHSAIVGASGQVVDKDTEVYAKQKADELLAANSVTDQAYTDAEVLKITNGTYTADKATKDADGNTISTTYAKTSDLTGGVTTVDKATKDGDGNVIPDTYPKLASNNIMTGQNQFQGDTYFLPASNPLSIGVKIDKTNATVEILYSGATWAKLDKNGLYLNPTYVTEAASDNYTPSKGMIDGYISTHDELTTAHEYIRGLIQSVEQDIARLDGRGKSYGEIAYTTAELLAMNTATRDAAINAAIVAGYGGATYTPTNTDLVYDTGVGDGVQYHEWEYNGTNWVDNGEFTNAKASDSVFGLVKGNEYITIISGIMQVLKSDYATNLGTSGAYYTYTNIYDALARLTQAEADIDDHETRIGTAESEIDALQANISDLDDANLNESHSRMSPALLGTITNGTPVTDAYWNGRLNEIRLKGLTLPQLIKNGNFVTTQGWSARTNSSIAVLDSVLTATATANGTSVGIDYVSFNYGNSSDKYFIFIKFKSNSLNTLYVGDDTGAITVNVVDTWQTSYKIITYVPNTIFRIYQSLTSGQKLDVDSVGMINLTKLGTHPTLGVAWSSLTAEQVSAYIGNYKTNSEIVAEQTTNLVTNGTFATTSNWTVDASTFTVSSNTANITATAQYGGIYQNFSIVSGKNYAIVFEYLATQSNIRMIERISNATSVSTTLPAVTEFTTYSYFITANRTDTTGRVGFLDFNASGFTQFQIKNVRVYDITDSARTSGLYSFKPALITSTDGTITRTLDLSGIGRMNSLPSGIKDEFDTYVSTSTGERVHEHTLRTMRINLPNNGGWTKVAYDLAITNTEFTDNVTGWTAGGTPYPTWLAGGYLTQQRGALLSAYVLAPITLVTGKKYYVTVRYRVTSANCDSISVRNSTSVFGLTIHCETLTPTQNEWYTQSFYLTQAGVSTSMYIAQMHNASSSSTDTMEVDYFRIYDLTAIFNAGNEPTQAQFEGLLAMSDYTLFRIGLNGYAGSSTLTVPANNALPDAFISSAYSWSTYDALLTSAAAGIALSATSHIHLILPNATADTEAELYTYLQANPMVYVGGITEEVETNVIGYLKQTGTAMTIEITSDTFVLESGFSVKYVKDTDTVIAALAARVTALE